MKRLGVTRRPRRPISGSPDLKPTHNVQKDAPPPYTTPNDAVDLDRSGIPQLLIGTNAIEASEFLRARSQADRRRLDDSEVLGAPTDTSAARAAASSAARNALAGMIRALEEPSHSLVACRTAQAIATAVSTSRSYAAFVAALTAVESFSRIISEADRELAPSQSVAESLRAMGAALRAATDTAMAADAGITPIGPWPFNIQDSPPLGSS